MTLTELNAHIAHAGKGARCKAQHLTTEGRCVNCGFNPGAAAVEGLSY